MGSVWGPGFLSEFVTDTHALYWHMGDDPRLSDAARRLFDAADQGLHRILVPSIVLVEIVYLLERRRLSSAVVERIFGLFGVDADNYLMGNLDYATARAVQVIPRSDVPDMPDRIIVATAWQLGLPLISRDEAIRRAAVVPIVW